jgi:hypothetical protein
MNTSTFSVWLGDAMGRHRSRRHAVAFKYNKSRVEWRSTEAVKIAARGRSTHLYLGLTDVKRAPRPIAYFLLPNEVDELCVLAFGKGEIVLVGDVAYLVNYFLNVKKGKAA